VLALLNAHFGQSIGAEWQPSWMNPPAWTATPYVKTTNNSGLLTPDATTLPGWSGANQIPLTVTGNTVTVNFEPIGANMTCQLVYRTTAGVPVYSTPVASGACTLNLTAAPASGVVIAVITNTDYVYSGETTRKAHYDYRLRLVTGVTGTASVNTKWYNSATLSSARTETGEPDATVGIDWSKYCSLDVPATRTVGNSNLVKMQMYPNPARTSNRVTLDFLNAGNEKTTISLFTIEGAKVMETNTTGMRYVIESKFLKTGTYLVKIKNTKTDQTQKLIVQ
jgi:hypothetical protein